MPNARKEGIDRMVKSYHVKIQESLEKICKEHQRIFKRYWQANKKKIEINHPTKKHYSIAYYPDFTIQTKKDNYYVFQILDSQADDTALIIPNVINAYLSENVKKLFFILKNEEYQNKTQEIAETLLANIAAQTKGAVRNPLKIIYIIIPNNADNERINKGLFEGLRISYKVEKGERAKDASALITKFLAGIPPETPFTKVYVGHSITSGSISVQVVDLVKSVDNKMPSVKIKVYDHDVLKNEEVIPSLRNRSFISNDVTVTVSIDKTSIGQYAYDKWAMIKVSCHF
jgi:hypothetical protein